MSITKNEINSLREEFDQWKVLLSTFNEDKAINSKFNNGWTLKDTLGHLTSWQQVTLARLNAALQETAPKYPAWFPGADAETNDELDRMNEAIYRSRKNQTWSAVLNEWQERFRTVLSVSESLSEQDLETLGRYPWLRDYPLVRVLVGSREHHEEHRIPLMERRG